MKFGQRNTAVPYRTIFGEIDLDVRSVTVDGVPIPSSAVNSSERVVAMHDVGRLDWGAALLNIRATLPQQEIDEGPWQNLSCLAVLSEELTNSRHVSSLYRQEDGVWRGSIELSRSRFRGRVSLGVVVVGSIENIDGRLLGSVDADKVWYIDIAAKVPVRQKEVAIKRVDFRNDDRLRQFGDALCITDTTSEQTPIVYLNTGAVEGLMDILYRTGGAHDERLLRELTFSQIAQDAWIAMFHTAISDLDIDDDKTPVLPSGWRGAVLGTMLPDILRGRSLTDALSRIYEIRETGEGWAELQSGIEYAVAKRSRRTRKLTEAVRSLDRNHEGAHRQ
ncbi:hypothetical protein [Nocardia transvalensis]|uniref:hypothetical protein n=1 Tax=Nocardia transvalensis TaxID=37333 RepID=UPI0018959BA6|nr:hypothetical protein [Nocardia transvalensis]MBF6329225.1 hypothetical protein [Nocardia transvalensis]